MLRLPSLTTGSLEQIDFMPVECPLRTAAPAVPGLPIRSHSPSPMPLEKS